MTGCDAADSMHGQVKTTARRDMTLKSPLIHVGYVKTGSTWLQKHVINHADQGFGGILTRHTITHALIKPYVLEYEQEPVAAEAASLGRNCEIRNLTPVVAHERLSGNPVSGGVDATILADRLLRLFPHGRILVVIREQKSHLQSIYNEYVNDGGACSMGGFFFPPDGAKLPLFRFSFLEFHRLIACYRALFTSARVLVLPYELLSREPLLFVNTIREYCGMSLSTEVPTNVERASRQPLVIKARRYANLLFYRDNANPAALTRSVRIRAWATRLGTVMPGFLQQRERDKQRDYITKITRDRYAASNRVTQGYTDFDLRDFGYET